MLSPPSTAAVLHVQRGCSGSALCGEILQRQIDGPPVLGADDNTVGENAARLATTQAYANSFGVGQPLPAVAASRGSSMGATAMRGAFGLNGIVGQGAVVPGQSSPMPSVASLSAQPTALAPDPVGFSSDPAAQSQQPSNQYAQIGNALKAAAAGQQR